MVSSTRNLCHKFYKLNQFFFLTWHFFQDRSSKIWIIHPHILDIIYIYILDVCPKSKRKIKKEKVGCGKWEGIYNGDIAHGGWEWAWKGRGVNQRVTFTTLFVVSNWWKVGSLGISPFQAGSGSQDWGTNHLHFFFHYIFSYHKIQNKLPTSMT